MNMDAAITFYKSFEGEPPEDTPTKWAIARAYHVDAKSFYARLEGLVLIN